MVIPDAPAVHVSTLHFRVPFAALWAQLSDPLRFPRLYPRWTSRVERTGADAYAGVGPGRDTFSIARRAHRRDGVVDFEIAAPGAAPELSRSRLFPLKTGGCVYVHVAVRWDGVDDAFWAQFKRDTDADLEQARRVLEEDMGTP